MNSEGLIEQLKRVRAGANLIWLGMLLSLVLSWLAVLPTVLSMGLGSTGGQNNATTPADLLFGVVLFAFIASVFGLVHGLIVTPVITLLLYKKRLLPSIGWTFGPAAVVAVITGPFLMMFSAIATGGTIIIAACVLRFALRDWQPGWRCQRCGYDLRGAAARVCPECGADYSDGVVAGGGRGSVQPRGGESQSSAEVSA